MHLEQVNNVLLEKKLTWFQSFLWKERKVPEQGKKNMVKMQPGIVRRQSGCHYQEHHREVKYKGEVLAMEGARTEKQ